MAAPRTSKKRSSAKAGSGAAVGTSTPAEAASGRVDADALPDAGEVAALLAPVRAFMHDPRFERARQALRRIAPAPPQVLLIEGGTPEERLAAAHYWSLLLNCPAAEEVCTIPSAEPCLACPACIRMVTHLHRDNFFFDGQAASIKIDEVRGLRPILGEPPREARRRMVVFREAQALVEAAANALLKSFEDPCPGTAFVMTAPQRERLLPTLVSRSVPLTLPWPRRRLPHETDSARISYDEMRGAGGNDFPRRVPRAEPLAELSRPEAEDVLPAWEAALCAFLQNGRDLFERTGNRGAVDAALVHDIINRCRHALVICLSARRGADDPGEGLERYFARLSGQRLRYVDEALAEAQDSLIYGVNPALVVEWLATRLYLLLPRKG